MPIDHRWSRSKTAVIIVILLLALAGWLTTVKWKMWFPADRQTLQRPATINNVVLKIESNIIRIQTTMENLVFSEYSADLANDVESVNQLEVVIYKDFKEMGEHFSSDNAQYQKALALFREWKSIRDEVISLTTAGPSLRAKEIVRGKCADHAQKIREALMELNRFSQKRAEDFDPAASEGSQEKPRNQ